MSAVVARNLMDILRLLDELNDMVLEEPRRMGPFTMGLDREEVSMMISKIRASLPTELKQAASTVRESEHVLQRANDDANQTLEGARREAERIIGEAQGEAQRMIERAKIEQERMTTESEVLKLAKAQSEEIRNAADRESKEMRRGAERYAYDVLSQLEAVVGKVATTIERGKSEVRPASDPIQPVREKVMR